MRSRTPCFRNRCSYILIMLMLQEYCPGYWDSTRESDHSGSDVLEQWDCKPSCKPDTDFAVGMPVQARAMWWRRGCCARWALIHPPRSSRSL